MTLATALSSANFIMAAILFAVFIGRGVYRTLPVFIAYHGYSLLFVYASLAFSASTPVYLIAWSAGTAIDTVFYVCVLLELGRAVLRYNRASAPPSGLVLLLFLGASVPLGLLTQWPQIARLQFIWRLEFRMMQATAVLEVAALLTIAWWTGFNKMHWPERELRLVMGMGSWALVQFCALILHEQGLLGPRYRWLDLLTPAAVLGVLIYWLQYFWLEPGSLKEAPITRSAARVPESSAAAESDAYSGICLAERR